MKEQIQQPQTVVIDRSRVEILMQKAGFETYGELAVASKIHSNTLVRILQGGGWQSKSLQTLAKTLMCHPFDMLVAKGFAEPSLAMEDREPEM